MTNLKQLLTEQFEAASKDFAEAEKQVEILKEQAKKMLADARKKRDLCEAVLTDIENKLKKLES